MEILLPLQIEAGRLYQEQHRRLECIVCMGTLCQNIFYHAYISGHATFSAANAAIMRNYFKTDNVSFTLSTEDPNAIGVERSFNSFSSAALENGRSRIYLGVHFQWDGDHGFFSGTSVGDYIYSNSLRKI